MENSQEQIKKYRPANGSEGEWFMNRFCYQCVHDQGFCDAEEQTGGAYEDGCEIIARTMGYDESDPEYPDEWTYDKSGMPICTAFCRTDEAHPPTETQRISMVDDQTLDMFGA